MALSRSLPLRLCPLVTPPTTSLLRVKLQQAAARACFPFPASSVSLSVCLSLPLPLFPSISLYWKVASGSVLALLSRPDSYYCIVFFPPSVLFLFFSFCYILFSFFYVLFSFMHWNVSRLGERKSRWERVDNIDNVRRGRGAGAGFLSCHGELTRQASGLETQGTGNRDRP